MKIVKRIVMLVTCLLPILAWAQTAVVKGVIVNEKMVPLADAVVVLSGTNYQSTTDKDGKFEIRDVDFRTYTLTIQDVEYANFGLELIVDKSEIDLGQVKAEPNPAMTNKEADVPVVTLDDEESQGGTAQTSVSSVLGASRDAFASAANFNFSIARFKSRGYDDENFSTLMNGVVQDDLTSGRTSYSSWSGLNDVLRSRESTTGLNPSNYSFGGIGGAYSIDSRAARQRKQLQATYSIGNRTYDNRFMLTWGSGFDKKGWAFAASISKRWANEGYVKGTYYDGFAYYFGISKLIDNKNEVDFTVLGSQYESGRASSNTQEVYAITGDHYYNSNWGYQNGKVRNSNIGKSHQPLFIITHEYKLSNTTAWTTALSYTTGKRESTALNWFGADPRPTYYRNLPSWQTDSVLASEVSIALTNNKDLLQLNWDNIILGNSQNMQTVTDADGIKGNTVSGKQAVTFIENRITKTTRGNFNTTVNTLVNDNVNLSAGLSIQKQTSTFYKVADDLLGADFFVDIDKFASQDFQDVEQSTNDLLQPNHIIRQGYEFGYNYEAHITKADAWSQAVAKYNKVDLFGAMQIGYTSMYRKGNYQNGLFPDNSLGKSKTLVFPDIAAKAGLTWKLNGRNYLFANGGFLTRAPFFNNVYLSPRSRNSSVFNPVSEKISSVEGGYILTSPKFKAKLKGYYTHFTDGIETRAYYLQGFGTNSYVNYTLTGIEKIHTGSEISVDANLGKGLSAIAVASIGQYYYSSRPKATITVDNTNTEQSSGNIVYMKNLHVENVPQQAYTVGLNYRSKKFWYVGANLNYFANMYVDPAAPRRTADIIDGVEPGSETWNKFLGQERFDNQLTVDLNAGWSIKLNNKIKSIKRNTFLLVNLGITNLLDNKNIITNGYEQGRTDKASVISRDVDVFSSKYSYAFGRTFMLNFILRMN